MTMNEFDNLKFELLKMALDTLPVGTLETGDMTVKVEKTPDTVTVVFSNTVPVEEEDLSEFDDTEIKETIKEFKKNLEDLDDCVFVESFEEFKQQVDAKKFDLLLSQESFSEQEAKEAEEGMECFTNIIIDNLQNKVQNLISLHNRFN
jgi:hypothetical protein